MSAKTRYYLEQSIPELDDLFKKGLFTKEEITHIIKKRTDFEHRLASRGSKTRDYLKYIDFEKNLEKLRSKRYNRLNSVGLVNTKPSISDWAGERRVLFIFDRSVQKFPSDFLLWENYLNYLKTQKLFKKIYKVYNQLLKLHPSSVESWINAASFEFDFVGSAKNARILFQKGLRFNKHSSKLWFAYLTFELNYISKLLSRRQLLGLMTEKQQLEHQVSEAKDVEMDEEDSGLIKLDNDLVKSELNSLPDADLNMLGSPETNPALKGDVALTIYDVMIETLINQKKEHFGMSYSSHFNEYEFKIESAYKALSIFQDYDNLSKTYLASHVINKLLNEYSSDPKVIILDVLLLLRFDDNKAQVIDTLQSSTNKYLAYKSKLSSDDSKTELKSLFVEYLIENFISNEKVDDSTKKIMNSIIKKL
jgi:U3 small nucleolar RNA-associated protein 6